MCHMSAVMCHMPCVRCHLSRVGCQVPCVRHFLLLLFKFLKIGWPSQWRVGYQRALPRLVTYYNEPSARESQGIQVCFISSLSTFQ